MKLALVRLSMLFNRLLIVKLFTDIWTITKRVLANLWQITHKLAAVIASFLRPDRWNGVLRLPCLFVCVFVCPRLYLRNYTYDLRQIFCACYPWPRLGPALSA